jgi:hypothetical protein
MNQPIQPNQLEIEGYSLQSTLTHSEIGDFIKPYFFKRNPVMIFYGFFSISLLVISVYSLIKPGAFLDHLSEFSLGIALFFLLVPIHELIHGFMYRRAGALNVSYKAEWKKLIFYAMADKFVTFKKPFLYIALAPFMVINSLLILVIFLAPSSQYFIWMGALFMHTGGCSGDFALISYFYTFWEKDPVTFDDVERKVSYFYIKDSSK